MVTELRKFVAPEFVFGPGALDLAGQYARNFGSKKALLVTDAGVMAAGWARKAAQSLKAAGVDHEVFADISPNPRVDEVMAGVEWYQEKDCDLIVSIGGGSPIDCAKGIGIAGSNDQNLLLFEGIDNVGIPGPPLICIPTTAGTSADLSQFAMINDPMEKVKIAIISKHVVPDVALIDPSTTLTMDSRLTACTGMDALVHAIEAYVSLAHSPIFDLHALKAVDLISTTLVSAIRYPDIMEYRTRMMLASLEAGLAFSNAGLGAVHAMAHSLGGFLDFPHGECNALLLEYVMAYNYHRVPERYEEIGKAMGLDMEKMPKKDRKKAVLDRIRVLKQASGITGRLGDRGVEKGDIPKLALKAVNDVCMVTNPRRPESLKEIEAIYEQAL